MRLFIYISLMCSCYAHSIPEGTSIEFDIHRSGDIIAKCANNTASPVVFDGRMFNAAIAVRMWYVSGAEMKEIPRSPPRPLRPFSEGDCWVVLPNEAKTIDCGNIFRGFGNRLFPGRFILTYTYSSDVVADRRPLGFVSYMQTASSIEIADENGHFVCNEIGPVIRSMK